MAKAVILARVSMVKPEKEGLSLEFDAVKNTGKTRYKCLEKHVSFFLFR